MTSTEKRRREWGERGPEEGRDEEDEASTGFGDREAVIVNLQPYVISLVPLLEIRTSF